MLAALPRLFLQLAFACELPKASELISLCWIDTSTSALRIERSVFGISKTVNHNIEDSHWKMFALCHISPGWNLHHAWTLRETEGASRVLAIYRFPRLARVHTFIVTLESIHLCPHIMSSVNPDKQTSLSIKATNWITNILRRWNNLEDTIEHIPEQTLDGP